MQRDFKKKNRIPRKKNTASKQIGKKNAIQTYLSKQTMPDRNSH